MFYTTQSSMSEFGGLWKHDKSIFKSQHALKVLLLVLHSVSLQNQSGELEVQHYTVYERRRRSLSETVLWLY